MYCSSSNLPTELLIPIIETVVDAQANGNVPLPGQILLDIIHIDSRSRNIAFSLPHIWRTIADTMMRSHTAPDNVRNNRRYKYRNAVEILRLCVQYSNNTLERICFDVQQPSVTPCLAELSDLVELFKKSQATIEEMQLPATMSYCSCHRCVKSNASFDSQSSVKATTAMLQLAGPSLKSLYLQLRGVSQSFLIAQKWQQVPLPRPKALTIDIDATSMAFPEVAMLCSKLVDQVKTFTLIVDYEGLVAFDIVSDELRRLRQRSCHRIIQAAAGIVEEMSLSVELYDLPNMPFGHINLPHLKRFAVEATDITAFASSDYSNDQDAIEAYYDYEPWRGFLMPNVTYLDVPARLLIDIDAPNVEHLTARFSNAPDGILDRYPSTLHLPEWHSIQTLRLEAPVGEAVRKEDLPIKEGAYSSGEDFSTRGIAAIEHVLKALYYYQDSGQYCPALNTVILTGRMDQEDRGLLDSLDGSLDKLKQIAPETEETLDDGLRIVNEWSEEAIPCLAEFREARVAFKKQREGAGSKRKRKEDDDDEDKK